MGPTIGRSIGQGFHAANASWAGMAVFGASWLLVGLIAVVGIRVTNPPAEVFEERAVTIPDETEPEVTAPEAPKPTPTPQPAAPEAAAPEATALEATPPSETPTDLFEQLETAPMAPPAPAPEDLAAVDDARRDRLFNDWVGRAWPLLLVCAVFVLGAGVWLNGGQIGYLVQRVRAGQAKVADVWRSGTRAFGALLGGWVLSVLGLGALLLAFSAFGFVFQALPNAIPDWLVSVLALILIVGAAAGVIWLFVRLAFWFIAIVGDGLGPIVGMKASFRATRGRWWKVAALGLLATLISYAALIPSMLLEWVAGRVEGALAVAMGVLATLAGVAAGLYVGFAVLAAYIRFYEDVKTAATAPVSATP